MILPAEQRKPGYGRRSMAGQGRLQVGARIWWPSLERRRSARSRAAEAMVGSTRGAKAPRPFGRYRPRKDVLSDILLQRIFLTPGNFCCSIKVYGFHVRPREEREEHR
jgi:hypothetical protein